MTAYDYRLNELDTCCAECGRLVCSCAEEPERAPECECGEELRRATERMTGVCGVCAGELADWAADEAEIAEAAE